MRGSVKLGTSGRLPTEVVFEVDGGDYSGQDNGRGQGKRFTGKSKKLGF